MEVYKSVSIINGIAIQEMLHFALHSVRSLLCTATNCTPHERLFQHNRKGSWGVGLPSWLCKPGQVLMRRNVRSSKYEPMVDVVDLLEANPRYAHVRLSNGKESTVSLKHLAPAGDDVAEVFNTSDNDINLLGFDKELTPVVTTDTAASAPSEVDIDISTSADAISDMVEVPRRSTRQRLAPDRFVP